ncbi:beta-N-acetylhexosaminidase [Novosphingobium sp. 9U]|uniref:beta-N-acetylhexosaminidase n=1 Tax=Novosphingobium sp. 9U TaxID=2653158 RepID=UPI0012EF8CA8|nr:beta-N-acetylhexosaminidase [Novosphingobium sp. 9U]VWX46712.1 Hexosaminidase [Novosphingobium sp. 9U]
MMLGLILASALTAAQPRLLPQPQSVAVQGEGRALRSVRIEGDARQAGARLKELLASQGIAESASGYRVRFVLKPGMPAEGYRLITDKSGATITATDEAGLIHGAVTFWQLASQGADHRVPEVTITDAPRFAWRGVMLDSARHFQSPAFIRHLLDWMEAHKLNRLHWHLVDDQGWRLEIRKYPRLTQVSGSRVPASAPGAPALPPVSGFYTQAEVRALVAYAAERGIVIVPEIEMPGHATSAIRAYPKLGMGVPLPKDVWSDWGVFPWLYNTDEPTFGFLQDVLTEVMELFPSPWIHIGGDEAAKEQWKTDPSIQARIKALGLKDENALQGWFMARVGKLLAEHGRRMIGWDEVLEGGVPADATVMSWRGIDGAITAARSGHDTILSPAPVLYLDHRQGTGPQEPPGRGMVVSLADVYAFDPAPAALTPDQRRHILGLQANLWTEHVRTEDRAAWMLFPRVSAVAEIAWSASKGSYADFISRLRPQLDRLRPLGLAAADTAFQDPPAAGPLRTCTDKLTLDLEDDYPATGPRARLLVDIMNPCWMLDGSDKARRIALTVGQLPFNYQLGADRAKIVFRPPATAAGEFEVRDGCEGDRLAVLPLAKAADNPGTTRLEAPLSRPARSLCITYTAKGPDPLWAVQKAEVLP